MKPSSFISGSLLIVFLIFFSNEARSYFETSQKTVNPEMNGIHFKDYKDFTEKWKLVTVRYRQDSKEVRMVYANQKAWDGLKKLKPTYSEGAMFAKVSFITESDPAFVSSSVPSGTRRYQFMLKDNKKYASTQGWGYALFTSEGQLYNEDVKTKTLACAACHQVVPERDHVFSRPMQLHYNSSPFPEIKSSGKNTFGFKTRKSTEFRGVIQSYLDPKKADLVSLEGDIQKHAFAGTLDEIVPVLMAQSKSAVKDAVLFVDTKNFSLIRMQPSSTCGNGESGYRIVIFSNNARVRDGELCH